MRYAVFLVLVLMCSTSNAALYNGTAAHPSITLLHAFGDSITQGQASTPSTGNVYPNGYIKLLNIDVGLALTRRAVPGAMACDLGYSQIFPNENPGPAVKAYYALMTGLADADVKFNGPYEVNYNMCEQAFIAWLGIPSTFKTMAQSCIATGSWANDAQWASGVGVISTTSGSKLTCSLTTSGLPLYIWYITHDSDGGSYSYSVDGGTTNFVNTQPVTPIATGNGGTRGSAYIRITGLASGSHTVVISVVSATSASNSVSIGGIGTPAPASNTDARKVYVAGATQQYQNNNGVASLAYYNDAIANVNLLAGDGIHVIFVPVRTFFQPISDPSLFVSDSIHPSNLGHSLLRNAFESVWSYD